MFYRRITCGFRDKGKLVDASKDPFEFVTNPSLSWFASVYEYTEEQKKQFDESGTISGITDVTTTRLVFDFDSKNDLELARKDTIVLCERLKAKEISGQSVRISFSGMKGYSVEVELEDRITVEQFQNTTRLLANGLSTWDPAIGNASRQFRIVGTKHSDSGLYKSVISYSDLVNLSSEDIKTKATDVRKSDQPRKTKAPKDLIVNTSPKKEAPKVELDLDIDFTNKIKGWSNCKWALYNGYEIRPGDRHHKILSIIATSKALNYPKEAAYYNAKNAIEKGIARYGGEKVSKDELWNDLVESVYNPNWKGGTFSCKDGKSPWLTELCESLGPNKCKHDEKINYTEVADVFNEFKQYAKDVDKNTIKTGIKSLDESVKFMTGRMIGILGAPSSGKTALALELLENTSRQGLLSVFYSLDMSSSELFQKIAQRVTGYTEDYIYKAFQTNESESKKIEQQVKEAYTNVKFCFDTGVSVDKIEESISEFEQDTGNKVQLLLLDYNELLSSPYSDSTASSGYNAGALKKLTNNRQLCTISLLQPPKIIGDASDEIISYRSIKGSSLLEQCFSIVIAIYRPGFTAKDDSVNDKFMVMNCVKNRLGKLFSVKFKWNGLRGKISEIEDFELEELNQLIESKKQEKIDKSSSW